MSLQVADLFASLGLRPDEASWKRGDALIQGVKKGLAFFAGFEAVKGVAEAVKSTIDLGGHLDDLRQKTGLTAEALQEYGYIAKLGGSDMDSFAGGVTKFARTLNEAKQGSKQASDALAHSGLTAKGLHDALAGGSGGLDSALMAIADHFAKLPDGPAKTALAMELFGKSGAELIPTLNRGAAGIADLRKEARDLGVVMGESTVGAADELGDNIDKLHMSITGLKNQAIAALLPTLKEMVDGALAWVKANKQLIIDSITVAVHVLIDVLKGLAKAVGVVVDVFQFLQEHGELARALLIGLGVVIGAVAAEAAAAWIIGFAPVLAAIAIVTALVLVFQDLLKAFLEGKGVIATVARWIADRFEGMGKAIVSAFKAVGRFFEGIADAIKGAFVAVFDWIADKVKWAWTQVKKIGSYVTHPWDIPGDLFNGAIDYFSGSSGDPSTPSAPASRNMGSKASPPVVLVDAVTKVMVTGNLPPDWIETNVDKRIKTHHDATWRDANAATGGDDEADQ
jgi:hypothetical protein